MLAAAERSPGSFHPATARRVRADRALVRQIGELAGGAGVMTHHEQRAWASITFSGTRHRMTWCFDGAEDVERGERLIELLPDHEFDIPRQMVADVAVTEVYQRALPAALTVNLELLLLEEA